MTAPVARVMSLAIRGATRFFVLTFAVTLGLELPYRFGGDAFGPLVVLSFFAPLLVAAVLTKREVGSIRPLFRPIVQPTGSLLFYALALLMPAALLAVGLALYGAVTGDHLPLFYPPASAQSVLAMAVIPFTEQIAWRGYAYPRLEEARSPLVASLVLGFAWAAFHVMKHAIIGGGAPLALVPVVVVMMTAGTVFYTWLYRRTGGSLLVVVAANAGAYVNNAMTPLAVAPGTASAAGRATSVPLFVHTAIYVVLAVALVGYDRRAWRRSDRAAPGQGPTR